MTSICGGAYLWGRRRATCPTCEAETDFVAAFSGAYYGDILTCTGCGDAWSEGQRLERPFRRGWRAESIRRAQQRFEAALPHEDYLAAVSAELRLTLQG